MERVWLLARPVNDACLNLLLAELFMLTDRSEGKRETWDCLRRRLDDYEGVSKALGQILIIILKQRFLGVAQITPF